MRFTKDPDAVLDYVFDWTAWLADGETIASQTITADDGITVGSGAQAPSASNGVVTCWLSGGEVGRTYSVVCHIATSEGREDDRTASVYVAER